MFWRFKWFGAAFAVAFTVFMYQLACWETEQASMVHPVLVALSTASVFAVLGGLSASVKAGHGNLSGAGLLSLVTFLVPMALMHPSSEPAPVRETPYAFPSIGDYVLLGTLVFNFTIAPLLVFARVPRGRMILVDNRAYYAGDRPIFLPWMKYDVEKLDEIPVKMNLHCASGRSIVCEAALAADTEWCRENGIATVDMKQFAHAAAQTVKRGISERLETHGASWLSVGEVLDELMAVNPAELDGTAAGVKFRCLRFTAAASVTQTAA